VSCEIFRLLHQKEVVRTSNQLQPLTSTVGVSKRCCSKRGATTERALRIPVLCCQRSTHIYLTVATLSVRVRITHMYCVSSDFLIHVSVRDKRTCSVQLTRSAALRISVRARQHYTARPNAVAQTQDILAHL
jgi:hypothetical protein